MNNNRNLTIVMLTATALILGMLVVGVHMENRAYATASVKGGNYILATGQISSDIDAIYVVDIVQRRLNVYAYSTRTRNIEMGEPVDLGRLFGE